MSAIVVIPARYDSTRFPGKPLAPILGKPLIQHVYEGAGMAKLIDRVVVATDSSRIYQAVNDFGGDVVMTSADHSSGTDRIAEVAGTADYDIIVNVQGDEPIIRGEMIDEVVKLLDDGRADMGTLVKQADEGDDIFDHHLVKAVFDMDGFAMYFSRSPIPCYRDEFKESKTGNLKFFKHIGIYSYRRDVLLSIAGLPQTELESAEKLEQLRAMENGYRIKVRETEFESIGVDLPEDIEKVEQWLSTYS